MESFVTRIRGTDEDRARLYVAAARRRIRVPDLMRKALDSVLAAEDQAVTDSFFEDAHDCSHVAGQEASDE